MSYHFYDMGFKDGYKKSLQESQKIDLNEVARPHGMMSLEPDSSIYDKMAGQLVKIGAGVGSGPGNDFYDGAFSMPDDPFYLTPRWLQDYFDAVEGAIQPDIVEIIDGIINLYFGEPLGVLVKINPDGSYTIAYNVASEIILYDQDGRLVLYTDGLYEYWFGPDGTIAIRVSDYDGNYEINVNLPPSGIYWYDPNRGMWNYNTNPDARIEDSYPGWGRWYEIN